MFLQLRAVPSTRCTAPSRGTLISLYSGLTVSPSPPPPGGVARQTRRQQNVERKKEMEQITAQAEAAPIVAAEAAVNPVPVQPTVDDEAEAVINRTRQKQ